MISLDDKMVSLQVRLPFFSCFRDSQHFFLVRGPSMLLGFNGLLRKASGLPSCINTAPILLLHASVSKTKVLEKSGNVKTGVVVIAFLRFKMQEMHPNQWKESFFNISVSGLCNS